MKWWEGSDAQILDYARSVKERMDRVKSSTTLAQAATAAMGYGQGHGGAAQLPGTPITLYHAYAYNTGKCIKCSVVITPENSGDQCPGQAPVKLNPPYVPVRGDNPGWSGTVKFNMDEPKTCTCSIVSLMQQGCTCGGK